MEKNICLRTLPVMALCKPARSSFSLACVTIASLPGDYYAPNLHKPTECALLLSFWRCLLLANYSPCKHLPYGGKLAVAELGRGDLADWTHRISAYPTSSGGLWCDAAEISREEI